MAYDHTQYEVALVNDGSLAAVATIATWFPGMVPHVLRSASITVTNAIGAAGSLTLEVVTAGGAADSGTDADIIVIPNGTAIGQVVYVDGLNVEITPGQELIAHVEDACAAGDTANVSILVEPKWEQPENNTVMTEST